MKNLTFLLLSPLLAVTGCYPKRYLAEKPTVSFQVYSVVFFVFSALHYLVVLPPQRSAYLTAAGIVLSYVGIVLLLKQKWQVAVLLAWIGTNMIFLATGFHYAAIDLLLLVIYFVRDAYDDRLN